MEIKKLVLGLCALAVVTGAPQVFGSVLDQLREIVLKGKDGILSDDEDMNKEHDGYLRRVDESVSVSNRTLAMMRRKEIERVKAALEFDHLVYFRSRRAAIELEKARKRTNDTRQALALAREAYDKASLIGKGETFAKVQTLKLKLKANLEREDLALQESQGLDDATKWYIGKAQEAREDARSSREQRIEHLTKVVDAYINGFGAGCQEAVRRTLEKPDCDIVQKEDIRVMALVCLIYWASDDGSAESRVVERIEDVIQSHTDERWVKFVPFGDDAQLYERSRKEYIPQKIGYDYKDTTKFELQFARLDKAFGGANKLQGDARLHWEGEDDYRAA